MKRALTVDGITVVVEWKNIRTVRLRVYSDLRVCMSAPLLMSRRQAEEFILQKKEWLNESLNSMKKRQQIPRNEYVTGETVRFFGKEYQFQLVIVSGTGINQRSRIDRDDTYIRMYVHNHVTAEMRKVMMQEWYRRQLASILPSLISKWEYIMGVQASSWTIRNMKAEWGSCNHRRRTLIFNLQLAKKSERCIEFIVVHELNHIITRLHNKQFYADMDKYLPDWRSRKDEINGLTV